MTTFSLNGIDPGTSPYLTRLGGNELALVKAFRGELVPQNPDAEPASVLLERIGEKKSKS